MAHDPYLISASTIKEPPSRLVDKFKFLGPGFILSASIVGSGELIATTVLGAKAGFGALWIIIISCLAKVAVQLEFGKHAILTGETAMQAFNKLPGPFWGRGKWSVWTVTILTTFKVVQLGGILGGASVILQMLFPGISVTLWSVLLAISASLLIYNGKYGSVEKISLLMIALFTILTLTALFSLEYTVFRFTFHDIWSSLRFDFSGEIVGVAIGAFGITGVASDEILAYNYWCIEKGYAAYAGPREENEAWKNRASGWINVMYLDALVAMIIYTTVTVSFYLLGAAVLHQLGEVPVGNQVIETLALVYTQTLGNGVKTAYLVGGFFVLYSSLYASLAAWTRLFSDASGQLGWIDFRDMAQRKKLIAILAWIFPIIWAAMYLFINLPVLMVLSGGVVGSFLLLVVVFAALHFKYGRTYHITSSLFYDVAFWISVVSILMVGIYGIVKVIS
jgi:Mn2+/Fe2+ NRAMP family transporter